MTLHWVQYFLNMYKYSGFGIQGTAIIWMKPYKKIVNEAIEWSSYLRKLNGVIMAVRWIPNTLYSNVKYFVQVTSMNGDYQNEYSCLNAISVLAL